MKLFGPAPLPLDQRLPLDAALEDAFAPLRSRTANVGPARVRAAVRWSTPETGLRGLWTLNGRNALQRPIDSLANDYRTIAGEVATNAAMARRPAAPTATQAVRDSEPFAGRP